MLQDILIAEWTELKLISLIIYFLLKEVFW